MLLKKKKLIMVGDVFRRKREGGKKKCIFQFLRKSELVFTSLMKYAVDKPGTEHDAFTLTYLLGIF